MFEELELPDITDLEDVPEEENDIPYMPDAPEPTKVLDIMDMNDPEPETVEFDDATVPLSADPFAEDDDFVDFDDFRVPLGDGSSVEVDGDSTSVSSVKNPKTGNSTVPKTAATFAAAASALYLTLAASRKKRLSDDLK